MSACPGFRDARFSRLDLVQLSRRFGGWFFLSTWIGGLDMDRDGISD